MTDVVNGAVLVGRSGTHYRAIRDDVLAQVGNDDPCAVWTADVVERFDGPLVEVGSQRAVALAAALRREALDLEEALTHADPALAVEACGWAGQLRARADGMTP